MPIFSYVLEVCTHIIIIIGCVPAVVIEGHCRESDTLRSDTSVKWRRVLCRTSTVAFRPCEEFGHGRLLIANNQVRW